ncbi:MAG: amidohydrolase family protein, partial [Gemmatimonadetes bacterium]|nr:amidohydrolase family protein [Gemmatimonadota bacterium]NIR79003.1 amidohydrolase family protein [Gemmatimonadota bacterium]NIT89494.1 amidohydrolase family protein [Gemmatimonadota bacterium]NIU31514.1 amidohydrolase family protein [Gemmatimonadota bacterium]NIU36174.1 amidohydrolase family protein [Gemmatimonadota bacterium]
MIHLTAMQISFHFLALAALPSVAGCVPEELPPGTVAVTDVHVIAMDGSDPRPGATVLVRDGRIEAVVDDEVPLGEGAEVVDGGGGYLLPGLTDMHVHVRQVEEFGLYLAAGVTTVRNMNGRFGDALEWKALIARGELRAPRFVTASPTLFDELPDYPWHVEGPERARGLVRRFEADGYDMIKVYRLREPTVRALVDEAAARGIPVVGHIPVPSLDLPAVLELGFASLEHLDEFVGPGFGGESDYERIGEVGGRIRASGVTVGTILSQWEAVNRALDDPAFLESDSLLAVATRYFGEEGLERARAMAEEFRARSEAERERDRSDFDFLFALLRELHRAGVNVVASTDAHQILAPAGESLHNEMELFVRAGLSPTAALETATTNAARALGNEDVAGTIAPGKNADLVLVEGNPLEDLSTLRRPLGV